jgi:hypothetical protein
MKGEMKNSMILFSPYRHDGYSKALPGSKNRPSILHVKHKFSCFAKKAGDQPVSRATDFEEREG